MKSFLPLLILTVLAGAPTAQDNSDAVAVFHCDFTDASDVNFDRWPDHWTRAQGIDYPPYVKIRIHEEASRADKQCLRMSLDGAAAAAYSPLIEIDPDFNYLLEGYLRTEDLRHDVAYYSISFLDAQQEPLVTHTSQPERDAEDWQNVRLGPLTPPGSQARLARIGLHLRPTDRADLVGAALFDDVRLARLPRVSLEADRSHHVYLDSADVEIRVHATGLAEPNPRIRLEAISLSGQPVDHWEAQLVASPHSPPPLDPSNAGPTEPLAPLDALAKPNQATTFSGAVTWRPRIQQNGFYYVIATLLGGGAEHQERLSLVVMEPAPIRTSGEFGWSLPKGEDPLEVGSLVGLLPQVGINWVKFPVWFSDNHPERADRLAWLAEQLSDEGIELVGVLDQPPADARNKFGHPNQLPVAAVFAEPDIWRPLLDPVMIRLALDIRWWQLGSDSDTSYVGYPDLVQEVTPVKSYLRRFNQSSRVGMAWQWSNELDHVAHSPCDFLSISTASPPTSYKLRQTGEPEASAAALTHQRAHARRTPGVLLDPLGSSLATSRGTACQRWVVLEPLPSADYDTEARTRDLVLRMLRAKIGRADRIFISNPFHPENGLMDEKGTPSPLLLPWRTAALMLSAAEPIGSIELAGGSQNEILSRGEETIMVLWNDHPVTETIYLGDDVRQVDPWGEKKTAALDGNRQIISAGPLPTFITGLNPWVARWRLSFALDNKQLASVAGQSQRVSYRFTNCFPQAVSGRMTFQTPAAWGASPEPVRIALAANEEQTGSFPVTFGADASGGTQTVRVNFEIQADQLYQFTVYRSMKELRWNQLPNSTH